MTEDIKRITIKVGSNVLTRPDGTLDVTRMSHLIDQMATLHKEGKEIVLVSSGAVASGRSEYKIDKKLDSVSQRQLYSALGQVKLLHRYYELFREQGIYVGQVLTMKENFSTRRHYLNQKNCIEAMLDHQIIPIVNENDTVSITELMFTDNDELSGLIATMTSSDVLIILSNIDGIYNGSPTDPSSSVIREVLPENDLSAYIQSSKSSLGRGGMFTKTSIASKVASEGIQVIIANGKRDNILLSLLQSDDNTPCTRFRPAAKEISGLKKWLAHSEGFAKGTIYINQQAVEVLHSHKATSLLPVGIARIEGNFEKDDIVRILSESGASIGVGRVSIDAEEAQNLIGKHGQKPVIHYDYMCLE